MIGNLVGDAISVVRTRRALATGRPILVYTVGKTGSMSLYRSLLAAGAPGLHLHYARFDHQRLRPRTLFRYLVVQGGPCDVVTMIRDPFARNISSFIETLPRYLSRSELKSLRHGEELVEPFLTRFDHLEICHWFDRELRRTTGLDVFAAAATGPGVWRTETSDRRLLVLSSHISPDAQAAALGRFCRIDDIRVSTTNVTGRGAFAEIYRQFADAVSYPTGIRQEIEESRFFRHFAGQEGAW